MSIGQDSRLVAIVDDDESVRRALQDLIETEGLSALCFDSAEQFLDSETRYQAACVISDIRLPGMSGLDLHTSLRMERSGIPVIFISGHGDVEMRTAALRDGAVEFLTKPFDDAVLLEIVHVALERSTSAKVSNEAGEISVGRSVFNGGSQMKALVLNALGGGFDFENIEIARPLGREVLVEVRASGLCHTDLLFATHNVVPTPAVLGHEVAGIVAEVGHDVTQFHVGDHVVGSLAQSCGSCARCLSGRSFQCQHPESTLRRPTEASRLSRKGQSLHQGLGLGGFAERALIHENQLALIPKELPFAQAALLGCGVVTGAGAVLNTAGVAAGETVVIFGAGGVGLNAISGARIAGASRIVVIDIQTNRLEAAKKFGATDVIDSTKTNPVEAVRDLLLGGADHVFDFVGLKVVAEQGLAMLVVGGGLYLVGVANPEVNLDLNIFDAIGGQKRVQGVNFGSTNFKRDIPMYAELYLQGRMNLDDLVSKRIALGEVNDGYAALKDGSLNRVVVTSF